MQQVFTLPCGYQYYDNAGNGRSFGPELEINAKLAADWTATFSGAWTDAKITQPNAAYTNFLENVVIEPGRRDPSLHGGDQVHGAHHERGQGHRELSLTYATTVWRLPVDGARGGRLRGVLL